MIEGFFASTAGGAPSFTGLLDGLNQQPQFAVSLRRLTSTSWATDDPILRLRRSSDNAEADFSYSNSNKLDGDSIAFNATLGNGNTLTTWAGVDTLYVVRWWNQVCGNYLQQATLADQPIYVINSGITNSETDIMLINDSSLYPYDITSIGEMYNGVFSRTSSTGITETLVLENSAANPASDRGRTIIPYSNGRTYVWLSDGTAAQSQFNILTPSAYITTSLKQWQSYRDTTGDLYILGQLVTNDTRNPRPSVYSAFFKGISSDNGGTHYEHIFGIYNLTDNTTIATNQQSYYGI